MSRRLSTLALCEALDISRATLARRVNESTRARIPIPRVPTGPGVYRWRSLEEIEGWLQELDSWRRSTAAATAGASRGATPEGDSETEPARTMRRRGPSPGRSSAPSPSAEAGSLIALARSLAQPTSA